MVLVLFQTGSNSNVLVWGANMLLLWIFYQGIRFPTKLWYTLWVDVLDLCLQPTPQKLELYDQNLLQAALLMLFFLVPEEGQARSQEVRACSSPPSLKAWILSLFCLLLLLPLSPFYFITFVSFIIRKILFYAPGAGIDIFQIKGSYQVLI